MGLSGRQRIERIKRRAVEIKREPVSIEGYFPPVVEEPTFGVPFMEIRNGQCRWPVGGDGLDHFRFCGERAAKGNYCFQHHECSRGRGTRSEQMALEGLKLG
jgi:hypothetical protein